DSQQVDESGGLEGSGRCLERHPVAGKVRLACRARGRHVDDDPHSGEHVVPAAAGLPSAHLSKAIAHGVDKPTYLDRRRTEHQRPAMERSGDIADDEPRHPGAGQLGQRRCDVRRTRRGEPPHPLERIEFELHGDLRPPAAVFDQEMCVELQAAGARDHLDVVEADAAVAAFPPRDRGLAEAEPFGQLALRESRATPGHHYVVATSHTKMVSVVCSDVWTEVWNPIPHLTTRKAPPHKGIGAALGPDYPPPT